MANKRLVLITSALTLLVITGAVLLGVFLGPLPRPNNEKTCPRSSTVPLLELVQPIAAFKENQSMIVPRRRPYPKSDCIWYPIAQFTPSNLESFHIGMSHDATTVAMIPKKVGAADIDIYDLGDECAVKGDNATDIATANLTMMASSSSSFLGEPKYVEPGSVSAMALSGSGSRLAVFAFPRYHGGEDRVVIFDKNDSDDTWIATSDFAFPLDEDFQGPYGIAINYDGTVVVVTSRDSVRMGAVIAFHLNQDDDDDDDEWKQMGQTLLGETQWSDFGKALDLDATGTRMVLATRYPFIREDQMGRVLVYDYDEERNVWERVGQRILVTGQVSDGIDHHVKSMDVAISADGSRIAFVYHLDWNCFRRYPAKVMELVVDSYGQETWIQVFPNIYADDSFDGVRVELSGNGQRLALFSTSSSDDEANQVEIYEAEEFTGLWKRVGEAPIPLGGVLSGVFDFSGRNLLLGGAGEGGTATILLQCDCETENTDISPHFEESCNDEWIAIASEPLSTETLSNWCATESTSSICKGENGRAVGRQVAVSADGLTVVTMTGTTQGRYDFLGPTTLMVQRNNSQIWTVTAGDVDDENKDLIASEIASFDISADGKRIVFLAGYDLISMELHGEGDTGFTLSKVHTSTVFAYHDLSEFTRPSIALSGNGLVALLSFPGVWNTDHEDDQVHVVDLGTGELLGAPFVFQNNTHLRTGGSDTTAISFDGTLIAISSYSISSKGPRLYRYDNSTNVWVRFGEGVIDAEGLPASGVLLSQNGKRMVISGSITPGVSFSDYRNYVQVMEQVD